MRRARLKLTVGAGDPEGALFAVDVLDPTMRALPRQWVPPGESEIDVSDVDGPHAIRVSQPSGGTASATLEVGGVGAEIDLDLRPSTGAGEIRGVAPMTMKGLQAAGPPLQVQLWHSADGVWKEGPIGARLVKGASGIGIELDTPRGLSFLHVSGLGAPDKLVALPAPARARVWIERATGAGDHPIHVTVSGANPWAESLLKLMSQGSVSIGQELLERVPQARRLLAEKVEDPMGATVGGYFVLRAKQSARLAPWIDNLAYGFDWLPDGMVLAGWTALERVASGGISEAEGVREAYSAFLEASRRGVPIYTEGLRLLHEGLRLFAAQRADDVLLSESAERVSRYAQSADWSAGTTTILGKDPRVPEPRGKRE